MPTRSLIVGTDGSNIINGTSQADLIYGFNPDGPQSQVTSIDATRVATGLSTPVFAGAPAGDPSRLFVLEKSGLIKVVDLETKQVMSTPFLDLTGIVEDSSERGLLGLAFDPDFATNGYFYVDIIATNLNTQVRRYQVSSNPNVADPASGFLVAEITQADAGNHKAGWIGFGPDGYLYVALGDGGGGGDPNNLAQNGDSLLGKMLRLDVHSDAFPGDSLRNYAIPSDNPFVGMAGADEIWALGLRNPWRDSFDRGLGTMYIADVGQGEWEEIDIGQAGANYGWRVYEGPEEFQPGTLGPGTLTGPIFSYDHGVGSSITGGYVHRGESDGLQGHYFYADFVTGKIFTLAFNGSAWVATERTSQVMPDSGTIDNVSSFGEDGFGNLYIVDYEGEIFRLTPDIVSADTSDLLKGFAGDDAIVGGTGDDDIFGGLGADLLTGGGGFDFARYDDATAGVVASLESGGSGGEAAGDSFISIEALVGSDFADWLAGNGMDNAVVGRAGDDTLRGFAGADTLVGDGGSDDLLGGLGADVLNGGAGLDFARYDDAAAGVVASLENGGSGGEAAGDSFISIEALVGSDFADWLAGNGMDNAVAGHAGGDTLRGFAGNDTLVGDDGSDDLLGGLGADVLNGGAGLDFARYDDAAAGVVASLASGGSGGEAAGDSFISIEALVGSDFADWLAGDGNANIVAGHVGSDTLRGFAGDDTLVGDGGSDDLLGGLGADVLDGGAGFDFARYDDATAGVVASLANGGSSGEAAGDSYVAIEALVGSDFADGLAGDSVANFLAGRAGDDTLRGLGGADTLVGDGGSDDLLGGTGADVLDGGAGLDFARYDDAAAGVVASLANGGSGGEAAGDSFISIEALVGSDFADWLAGNGADNAVVGHGGDDILRGFGGDDTLVGDGGSDDLLGGLAADVLDGGAGFDFARYDEAAAGVVASLANGGSGGEAAGDSFISIEALVGSDFADWLAGDGVANFLDGHAGNDTFAFNAALSAGNVDTIADFVVGADRISLDRSVFAALGAPGPLPSESFFVGTAAHDADDRVVYNSASGALLYDADGTGAGAAVQFAILSTGLGLTSSDFLVV